MITDCGVCMETLTATGDHEAKICPCGHTYCLICLRSNPRKECPSCSMAYGVADSLPRNFLLIELIASLSDRDKRKPTIHDLRAQLLEREQEECDKKINSLETELKVFSQQLNLFHATIEDLSHNIADLTKKLTVATKNMKEVELRMKQSQKQLNELKKQKQILAASSSGNVFESSSRSSGRSPKRPSSPIIFFNRKKKRKTSLRI